MCENSSAKTFRATIGLGRLRGRIIIAVEANFANQYFVLAAKKLFPHSLGQNRKSSVGLGMSGVEGRAEVDFGRLEVCF